MSVTRPEKTREQRQVSAPREMVTPRAVAVGMVCSLILGIADPYSNMIIQGSYLGSNFTPIGVVFLFAVLVGIVNTLLRTWSPAHALTQGELAVVYIMSLIASSIPSYGLTEVLLPAMASMYYATPENRWLESVGPHVEPWLMPQHSETVRSFFEGLPRGGTIPWGDWAVPLAAWLSFVLVLYFVVFCITVILRKQWVSHERLRFPLGEVALNLMGVGKDPNEPPMVRTTAFRIGVGLSLAAVCWNIASYWDIVTSIPIMGPDLLYLKVHPSIPDLPIRLNVFVLCFAFFINAEILFSLCFFLLFTTLQRGLMNMLGVTAATTMSPTGLVGTQSIGALIALVVWGLWMARRHLAAVARRAFRKDPSVDDSGEFFSYRVAVFGLIFGLLYLLAWLYSIGMSLPVSLVLLAVLFIVYIGMARIVAEAGLVAMDLPVNANNFTGGIIGADNLDPSTITALGMTNAFARNWRTFTMIGLSHTAFLQRWMGPAIRHLFLWICLAFAVSVVTSLYYYISAGYAVGADNLLSKPGDLVPFFYNTIMTWNSSASSVSDLELIFFGNGIMLYMLMILGRYLFLWWPLHPIGLVAVAADTVRFMFLPFLLAWLIQVILLRLGGGALYRKAQPLFLGILVGYVLGMALSFVVDSLWFPAAPHQFESFIN